jgi:hypothetical protein
MNKYITEQNRQISLQKSKFLINMLKYLTRNISKDPVLYQDPLNPSLSFLFKILGNDQRPAAHILGYEILHFIKSEKIYKCTL